MNEVHEMNSAFWPRIFAIAREQLVSAASISCESKVTAVSGSRVPSAVSAGRFASLMFSLAWDAEMLARGSGAVEPCA
jgi:hypothetical protein